MTDGRPAFWPLHSELHLLPEIERTAARFARAVAHPDEPDDQGRTLESNLDVSTGSERLASRQWRLHARRCRTTMMLIHPHGESTDPTTAALIREMAWTHDETRSIELNRIAQSILDAVANVVVHAQTMETGRIRTRNVRLRLPSPWTPILANDQDGRALLSQDALARLAAVAPIMAGISYADAIGPGHRSRSISVTARPIILSMIPDPIADPMEAMRVACAAPISPEDVVPTNPQGSLLP
jgi:hypothetical protein